MENICVTESESRNPDVLEVQAKIHARETCQIMFGRSNADMSVDEKVSRIFVEGSASRRDLMKFQILFEHSSKTETLSILHPRV
jgi:hypothetical protein